MTEVAITRARRSRYISKSVYEQDEERRGSRAPTWIAAPGYEDLVRAFMRNKVEVKVATAYFDHNDRFDDYGDDYKDISDLVEGIRDHCEVNCTGFWTMHQSYSRNAEYDHVNHKRVQLDTGRGQVLVCFENEQDVQGFLDSEIIQKLSN